MDFGSLISSALDFAGSTVGGIGVPLLGKWAENQFIGEPNAKRQWEREQASAREAFGNSYYAYKNRYQNTAKDMKAAGLNPILAASGGFSVGNAPQMQKANAMQPHQPNLDPLTSAKTVSEKKLIDKQKEESESKAKNNLSQAKLNIQKIAESRSKSKLMDQQEMNAVQEMFNLERQGQILLQQQDKINQEIQKLTAETELSYTQKKNLDKQRTYLEEQAKNLRAKTRQLKAFLKKDEKTGKVYGSVIGNLFIAIEMAIKSIIPLTINLR